MVSASYQWSGDAVYTIGQAAESDMQLSFAVPKESTNIYFDGWAMLKSGINGDEEKKQAAESFVNFVSMPENAVRNMYYIGYTSAISGGDSSVIYDYAKQNYGYDSIVEETGEEQEEAEYSLGYFFSGISDDKNYTFKTTKDETEGQLFAQYPTDDIMGRSAVMQYFDTDRTAKINQMWINVRCYNIKNVPVWVWVLAGIIVVALIALSVKLKINKKYD